MKKYELLTIIKPNMDTDEIAKITDKTDEVIRNIGGTVLSTDKIGRKKLSYDIQKFRDGFFVVEEIFLRPR